LGEIAEMLDVADLLDRRPADLSGGQRRRVALGRALLAEPELLLMDEPLTGLDWRLKAQILPYLHRAAETLDAPVIYVSHQLDELLGLADELVLLAEGRVVGTGTHLELLERPRCGELLSASGMTNPLSMRVVQHWHGRGMTAMEALGADGTACLNEFGRPVIVRAPLACELVAGSRVRIALDPEQIAVASAPVERISIQNQLPARVRRVFVLRGRVLCLLDAGVPLLAGITHQSCRELELVEGRRVWALFKTQAIHAASRAGDGGTGAGAAWLSGPAGTNRQASEPAVLGAPGRNRPCCWSVPAAQRRT
jgi:molybdate transport system ATP-binding protein